MFRIRDNNFIGFDKYKNKGAYHWDEVKTNPDYRQNLETVVSFVKESDTCLDIGCGDGAYMGALAKQCKAVHGIDADWHAINVGKKMLASHGIRNCFPIHMPISRASLTSFGVRDPFDLIYSMDVIEHLPKPEELLIAAGRLTRPTGVILIGTPLFISTELVSPYHVKEYTRDEIRGLVSSHLKLTKEIILPLRRKDGKVYEQGFYIAVAQPQ